MMGDEFLVLKPVNWEAVGELIYRIATDNKFVIPKTAQGRMNLLRENGVEFDDRVRDVKFHRSTPATMHIVIPPRELIAAAKAASDGAGDYVLPQEYVDYVEGNPGRLPATAMFFFRVGDYSLNHCK
jgi:hypothetical protein